MTRPCVTVFLDWQNVYKHAREAFHSPSDPHPKGQVSPIDLGAVLASRVDGELTAVRIYRGMPDNALDPKGYAAVRRHLAAWRSDPRIIVTTRRLRYADDYVHGESLPTAVKEKGIDVALALDVVTMATDGAYDIGIVMSCDHDLAPALERVRMRRASRGDGAPDVAVASWQGQGRSPRMRLTTGTVYCHWLSQEDYWGVMDERNYAHVTPADLDRGPAR